MEKVVQGDMPATKPSVLPVNFEVPILAGQEMKNDVCSYILYHYWSMCVWVCVGNHLELLPRA